MADTRVGDVYLFVNDTLGIEEECIVTEVHPLTLSLMTACGFVLQAIKGFNEKQFIPIRQVGVMN